MMLGSLAFIMQPWWGRGVIKRAEKWHGQFCNLDKEASVITGVWAVCWGAREGVAHCLVWGPQARNSFLGAKAFL